MKQISKRLILLGILFFLIHEIVIITDGLIDERASNVNVAVILGSKVNKDGTVSNRLKARLDKGLELYQKSIVKEIYVSGGLGMEGYLEGTVMAEYLIKMGVPETAIKIDNNGINTRNTALNFVRDYPNETNAYVVSQYFHISRCKLAFRQVGIKNVYGAHGNLFQFRDPYSAFREFFGYYKYLLFY